MYTLKQVIMKWRMMLLTICILLPSIAINAQGIKKEVYVISSYKPEVADANKITSLPTLNDTATIGSQSDYSVLPSNLKTTYSLRPIKPATMVGSPLDKLYKSYLNLGIGNYSTPLIEYSIHNLRSKEYAVGAYLFHKSSYTNLSLSNGASVPAGYGINDLKGYGKYFFNMATLSAEAGAYTYRMRYYGLNVADSAISIDSHGVSTKDIKQSYITLYGKTSFYSINVDSNSYRYSIGIDGDYFVDHFSNKEKHFNINGSLSQYFKGFRLGLEGYIDNASLIDSSFNYKKNMINIRPFVTKKSELWEVNLAVKIMITDTGKNKTYFFPDANIRFQVINNALVTYFGIDGNVENNDFGSTTKENPYILPGLIIKNTVHNYIFYGGIEGQLSRKASYRLDIRFDNIDNFHFFVKDTFSKYQNHFDVKYDAVDLVKYSGELNWLALPNLTIYAKADVYDYMMSAEKKPWELPDFTLTFAGKYAYKNKIFTELEYIYSGKRFSYNQKDKENPIELKPINDLNLKIEYKYSNIFSFYLDAYNLLFQKYDVWNQYPSQKLNVLVGLTYKF